MNLDKQSVPKDFEAGWEKEGCSDTFLFFIVCYAPDLTQFF